MTNKPLSAEQEAWHRRAAQCDDALNGHIIRALFATIDTARAERDEARADQATLDRVLAAFGIANTGLDAGDYAKAVVAALAAYRAETAAVSMHRDAALVELSQVQSLAADLAARLKEALNSSTEGWKHDARALLARAAAQGVGKYDGEKEKGT